MAGFMKNAMSYLGMSDVAEDDDFDDEGVDAGKTSFDSDHSVTPMPSSSTTVSAASAPREQSNPFQGGGLIVIDLASLLKGHIIPAMIVIIMA